MLEFEHYHWLIKVMWPFSANQRLEFHRSINLCWKYFYRIGQSESLLGRKTSAVSFFWKKTFFRCTEIFFRNVSANNRLGGSGKRPFVPKVITLLGIRSLRPDLKQCKVLIPSLHLSFCPQLLKSLFQRNLLCWRHLHLWWKECPRNSNWWKVLDVDFTSK